MIKKNNGSKISNMDNNNIEKLHQIFAEDSNVAVECWQRTRVM